MDNIRYFNDIIDAVFVPRKDRSAKILLMAQKEMMNPTQPIVNHIPEVRVKGDKNYE